MRVAFRAVKRAIVALVLIAILASATVAWAVQAGTYSGTSLLKIAGTAVTHPFKVKVKHGKVVSVGLIVGSNCAGLEGSGGLKTKFKISKHGAFSGTLKSGNLSAALFLVKIKGTFKGSTVKGSFSGKVEGKSSCSIPKNTFTARRG